MTDSPTSSKRARAAQPGDKFPDSTWRDPKTGIRWRVVDRELVSTPMCETEQQRADRVKAKLPMPTISYVAGRLER